jgi:hypothetical protein
MKNKTFLLIVFAIAISGCRVNSFATAYESVRFAPKPKSDSLWLFTPVVQYADFTEAFDRLVVKELKGLLQDKLVTQEILRTKHLMQPLDLNHKEFFLKSLQKTPVEFWVVCSMGSEKNDPFETFHQPKNYMKQQAVAYIRIFEIATGKEIYKQKVFAKLNKFDPDDEHRIIFMASEGKLHYKALQKALKNLKKDMGK